MTGEGYRTLRSDAEAVGEFEDRRSRFIAQLRRVGSEAEAEAFIAELSAYIRWYREGRLKAFREGGRTVYDTIRGRRRRLGLAA